MSRPRDFITILKDYLRRLIFPRSQLPRRVLEEEIQRSFSEEKSSSEVLAPEASPSELIQDALQIINALPNRGVTVDLESDPEGSKKITVIIAPKKPESKPQPQPKQNLQESLHEFFLEVQTYTKQNPTEVGKLFSTLCKYIFILTGQIEALEAEKVIFASWQQYVLPEDEDKTIRVLEEHVPKDLKDKILKSIPNLRAKTPPPDKRPASPPSRRHREVDFGPNAMEVAQKVRDRRIIPLAGTEISRLVKDKSGQPLVPSWSELLKRAESRLEGRPEAYLVHGFLEQGDMQSATQKAAEGLGPRWKNLLQDAFRPVRDKVDDASLAVGQRLWRLGSPVILTTSYDRILQWACPQPDDVDRWLIEAPAEQVDLLQNRLNRLAVWHLYGAIDQLHDMLLTPQGHQTSSPGQIEPALKQRFEAARNTLDALLVSHSFLLVGFRFENAHFLDQLAWIEDVFSGFAGPHYAIVRRSERSLIQTQLKDKVKIELIEVEDFDESLLNLLDSICLSPVPLT